jgi:RNA polymerase sigma-70 factor, ECF subfamily
MPAVAQPETLPVALARAGDDAAWRILFKRFQLPLYAYVFELVRQEQASLDVVQETFIRAVRHLPTLREDGKFGGWLFGIAHQQCLQHWRRCSRANAEPAELPELPDESAVLPADLLIRAEQSAIFLDHLGCLPPLQRSALLLHYLEDYSLEEIATITSAPLGTVKSRLHHAKRALKKILEENP